jgi:hypothetical protein
MSRLERFTFVSGGLFLAALLVLVVSVGSCLDDEHCPAWRVWLNAVSFVAACAFLVLTVSALLAILVVKAYRG